MFKILTNEKIAPAIYKMELEAPFVAKKAGAGQFVMIRIDENGERIPLTIAGHNDETIVIAYQTVGVTTHRLAGRKAGEYLLDVVGPLGHATEVKEFGTVCCIGGGVGIAELYPVTKAYSEAGNRLIVIIGARNKELVIFQDELRKVSDEIFITTDDGTAGEKGFVSDALKRLMAKGGKIDLVYAVGPALMMKAVSDMTKSGGIKTIVSLNTVLVDGTGMCGSCRIEVGGKTKFACVDGPEFDGHKVNFKELVFRQGLFKEQEKHACKIRGIGITKG
ncbi:MAG: sulfide/dihydroorotate dehydrogenase-like FAD/NAD-binding protein [Candidatus Omnitrophica bacterium]|nr:sulfide/dihydroorotate dehydrogenase-like FAD/NAD-binding protein [Candidatus Omnitrophota bacterium]MBU1933551.1 sulfide/dihydroorotate dehydrogenase-like FAD/NAD-binding protein [Candidatus Omnitrophota bacterium]